MTIRKNNQREFLRPGEILMREKRGFSLKKGKSLFYIYSLFKDDFIGFEIAEFDDLKNGNGYERKKRLL